MNTSPVEPTDIETLKFIATKIPKEYQDLIILLNDRWLNHYDLGIKYQKLNGLIRRFPGLFETQNSLWISKFNKADIMKVHCRLSPYGQVLKQYLIRRNELEQKAFKETDN